MTWRRHGLFLSLAIVLLYWQASSAHAWTYAEVCIGGPVYWLPPGSGYRDIPVYEMAFTPNWPENAMFTANYSALSSGAAWVYWMWARDGSHSVRLYRAGTYAGGYGPVSDGSWFGDEDDDAVNVYWWDTNEHVDEVASGYIGKQEEVLQCFFSPPPVGWWTETDVWIQSDIAYAAVATSTQPQCLAIQSTPDQVQLHEVGHSYGLGHVASVVSTMFPTINGHSHCNVASGYHPQPTADEMNGLRTIYPVPGTFSNISGMPFYNSGGLTIDTAAPVTGPCSSAPSVTARFTRMNHYTSGTVVKYRGVIVLASIQYPTLANVVYSGSVSPGFSMSAGSSALATYSITVPFSSLPILNGNYRLWIQMDPSNAVAESDEGDNWFPTNWIFRRTGSC